MANIITVISGKGGTGKTLVAVNLACGLKMLGNRVLLIDYAFGIRNDDVALSRTSSVLFNIRDLAEGQCEFDDAVVKGEDAYMPDFVPASPVSAPEGLSGEFKDILDSVSDSYDYIVIDTPASVGYEADSAFAVASRVIAVTDGSGASVSNTALCLNRLLAGNEKKVNLVINRFANDKEYDEITVEDAVDDTGAQLIGIIPEDEFVYRSLRSGDPIIRYKTDAGKALEDICRRICGEHIPYVAREARRFFEKKSKLELKNIQGGF